MTTTAEQWRDDIVALLPRLRRYCYSLTGSAVDADDLLQNTVEKALSKYDQFQQGTDLDRWMFRMCKNLWIDEWRSRRVRGHTIDPMDSQNEPWIDGETVQENKLGLRDVQTAMDKLHEEQRIIVFLIIVEGYSYKEAATFLSLPIGTVMSRLARARKALEQLLRAPEQDASYDMGGMDVPGRLQ
ncbi:MAG TPA: RNA polymerase sigma factor [Sphingomonadales bacterium]|nr:RNA polymerase sigma factor [Sphingomonadales bacterium]